MRALQVLYPAQERAGEFYILERTAVITGEHLTDAQPSFDQNNRPAVVQMNTTGARIFGQYTADNIGSRFAIVLDKEGGFGPHNPKPYSRWFGYYNRAVHG